MEKESILGIDVCACSSDELLDMIETDIRDGHQRFITAVNPEKILKAKNDASLAQVLNSADYQIPDGIGIVLASKLRRKNIRQRITGIGMMEMLCRAAARGHYKVFLYGAASEVVEEAKKVLEERFPDIRIAGYIDGYCDDDSRVVARINAAAPDIVFVALGSPKQEYWISGNKDKLNAKILQGVGGSFDVICGRLKRAPRTMQKLGLEWLFRLLQQPGRIVRQIKLLKYVYLVMKEEK